MAKDPIIEMSLLLKNLPYDIRLAKFSGSEGGYEVELHQGDVWGSGVSPISFAMAYTKAHKDIECKLYKATLASEDADVEDTYASLLMGAGRF